MLAYAKSDDTAPKMVLLHANTDCNLECTYCYQGAKKAEVMSVDTAVQAAALLAHDKRNRPVLLIHGGEPLLNGLDWFDALYYRLQERYDMDTFKISVQTNGTLITPEFAEWCARHKIRLGISLDGPPDINRATRGCSEKTIQGIAALRSAGVYFGVLCVLTKKNHADVPSLLTYFRQSGASSVRFNPVYSTPTNNVDDEQISGNEYAEAMQAAYRWQKEHPEAHLIIANLLEIFKSPKGNNENICNPCHAGRSIVCVVPGGDVFPCGRYAGRPEYRIGSLHDGFYNWESPVPNCSISCDLRNCSKGCPAMTGNAKDYLDNLICDYTKAMLPMKQQLNELAYNYRLHDSHGWSDYSDAVPTGW